MPVRPVRESPASAPGSWRASLNADPLTSGEPPRSCAHWRTSSSSRSLSFSGIITRTLAYRSPRSLLFSFGIPCPVSRIVRPDCVPLLIFKATVPPMVGTRASPPNSAANKSTEISV